MIGPARDWLAARLLDGAEARLRTTSPEWAEAMAVEAASVEAPDRLAWAWGCFATSLRQSGAAEAAAYALLLAASLAGMTAYQWSADENLLTLLLAGALALGLGLVSPRRFLISGVAIGLVVATVNAFEVLTGLRPAYEAAGRSLLHTLRWTVLVPPTLFAAAVGRTAALRFKT